MRATLVAGLANLSVKPATQQGSHGSKASMVAQKKRSGWQNRTCQHIHDGLRRLALHPQLGEGALSAPPFVPLIETVSRAKPIHDTALADLVLRRGEDSTTKGNTHPAEGFPPGELVIIHNGSSTCNVNPMALLSYLQQEFFGGDATIRLFVSSGTGMFSVLLVDGEELALTIAGRLQDDATSGQLFRICTTTPGVAGTLYADCVKRCFPVDLTSSIRAPDGPPGATIVGVDLLALLFPAACLIEMLRFGASSRNRVCCVAGDHVGGPHSHLKHLGPLITKPTPLNAELSSPKVDADLQLFGFPEACPGLYIIPNFVGPDEEAVILEYLRRKHRDETTVGGSSDESSTPKWDYLLGGRRVMHMNRRFVFADNSCGPTVDDLKAATSSSSEDWRALVPTHPAVERILERMMDIVDGEAPSKDGDALWHLRRALSYQHTRLSEREAACNRSIVRGFDQLTINEYPSGAGIPAHVDAHHCFHNPILSVSLGARECVMCLREIPPPIAPLGQRQQQQQTAVLQETLRRRPDAQPRTNFKRQLDVFLPRGSVLILSGQARYAFTHGIDDKAFHLLGGEVISPTGGLRDGEAAEPQVRYSISCRAAKDVRGCEECGVPHLCIGNVSTS